MALLSARITSLARRDDRALNEAVASLQRLVSAFDPSVIAMLWFEAIYRRSSR
jgi:hypothetical protein